MGPTCRMRHLLRVAKLTRIRQGRRRRALNFSLNGLPRRCGTASCPLPVARCPLPFTSYQLPCGNVASNTLCSLNWKLQKSETNQHATMGKAPWRIHHVASKERNLKGACSCKRHGQKCGVRWGRGTCLFFCCFELTTTTAHMKISHDNLLPCLSSVRMK